MNAPIIDPLQGDFPEVIEEYLEHGVIKCVAFNHRGSLLAAGCADGSCVIWDFETRGIAKELRDNDCAAAITSVSWSKYGHRLLVSAADKSLTLWDVSTGEKIARTTLQQTPLHARLNPGLTSPSLCLACPLSSAPMIVDFEIGCTTLLPVYVPEMMPDVLLAPQQRSKCSESGPPFSPAAACFNKCGDLVYVGNAKGEILIVDYKSVKVLALVPVSGGSAVKNIVFSRNGKYLLTNSHDRIIRIYENLLPAKDVLRSLEDLGKNVDGGVDGVEKLKAVGSKCLTLFREFQDLVTKMHWKAPCFSGDGEWVVGGSACKGEHKIYIWDRAGHLVKILEGPKEALIDLAWHPVHPVIVSVSLTGLVYIWAKDYTENWSAFAPDFKELEENEEYVEREDEFDLMPETGKVKVSSVNEDEEVDIETVEKDAFSDSDMSVEELRYLPAEPIPDTNEEQDELKLIEARISASPASEEAGQNGHVADHTPSPLGEMGETRGKRKRKPSEKAMELQAEKAKSSKASGRTVREKSRAVGDQEIVDSVNGDDEDDVDAYY
ncbi:protein RBL isoform X2 [Raphanus sativus]|uniref:Protein RBL isoform X2 n=1 Tax=Raphanus sativus TaxID=3726 RepID=A0A6J0LDQ8_RAPSA|nr:protein RBL isoform X2 [Raphanus sativus]